MSTESLNTSYEKPHVELQRQIQKAPEWVGRVDSFALSILLASKKYPFCISQDIQESYLISWLNQSGSIQSVPVSIDENLNKFNFCNGDPHSCSNLAQLIDEVLHFCEH